MAAKKKTVNVWDFLEPLEGGLIVTEPKAVATRTVELQRTGSGRLFVPQEKETLRATFGCVCKVLKVNDDIKAKFPKGSSILIHEHGGHPIYNDISTTKAWIISEGDILSKVHKDYWKHYDA